MKDNISKNNKKIIGSIIKLNRIKQNMSQKVLCKGICVPSYLSRIENGDLIPSEDVISILFDRLGLKFNDSEDFIEQGKKAFETFFHNLNFNEFDSTNELFTQIESKEKDYITSPLAIDYFLVKLARYCSTPNRSEFAEAQNVLLSTFDLLSPHQKFIYDFYVGVDIFNVAKDKSEGKDYITNALNHKETGHCYFWLAYHYRINNNPIKAYDCMKKALDLYVLEGNFLSIMDSYEKIAEVYFMVNNYFDAVHYLEMALNIARKIHNKHYIEHLNSMLAWTYYKLNDYDKSLEYLNLNTGTIDHRMVIPDSVVKSLIYFSKEDKENLKESMITLKEPECLEHISEKLADTLYKLFKFYIENDNYIKDRVWEGLLIFILENINQQVELKKDFSVLLKSFYIHNRRYKDALSL